MTALVMPSVCGRCVAQESIERARAYPSALPNRPSRQVRSDATIRWSTDQAPAEQNSAGRHSAGQASVGDYPLLIAPQATDDAEESESTMAGPVVTTVSSLLVVLAVFGGLVVISRRFGGTRTPSGSLPEDVLRNLGSAMVDAKTRVTFLKIGNRIVVMGQTQSGEPQTLSEITDPDEVSRLTNRCLGRPEIIGRRASYPGGAEASRRDLAAG